MNGQSCPNGLPCSVVKKDDFTGHYSVTMVTIAMRNIRYPTWECGGLLGLAQDLLGLWPQPSCWSEGLAAGAGVPPASCRQQGLPVLKEAASVTYPVLRVGK